MFIMCKEFLQVNERTLISKTGQTFHGSSKSGKFCTYFYVLLPPGGIWANLMSLRSLALEIYFNMEFSYLTKQPLASWWITILWNRLVNSSNHCAVVSLSVLSNSATLWTAACQAPLSMGILQKRILEWVAMPSSRGSSHPRDWTQVSHIAGGFFTS